MPPDPEFEIVSGLDVVIALLIKIAPLVLIFVQLIVTIPDVTERLARGTKTPTSLPNVVELLVEMVKG